MHRILSPFLVTAISLLAMDVGGRWWGETMTDGNSQLIYVTLIQQGDILKGSGGPTPAEQTLLANGKIQGKKVTFDIVPAATTPLHFDLAEEGEWLKGTVKVQRNGKTVTGTVSLRRRST